ncbi:MAG: hypothetical protein AB1938_01310 [Myxococcota bacterium]
MTDGGACLTAAECPGPFPPCEAGQACCGSVRQCLSGQCVQVAIECRDAGRDECVSARDCAGPIATTRACTFSGGPDAGFSCIQGQCIPECGDVAGRTCTWGSASLCLTCQQDVCTRDCPSAFVQGFTVEDIACGVGAAPWAPPTRFDVVRASTSMACDFALQARAVEQERRRLR